MTAEEGARFFADRVEILAPYDAVLHRRDRKDLPLPLHHLLCCEIRHRALS